MPENGTLIALVFFACWWVFWALFRYRQQQVIWVLRWIVLPFIVFAIILWVAVVQPIGNLAYAGGGSSDFWLVWLVAAPVWIIFLVRTRAFRYFWRFLVWVFPPIAGLVWLRSQAGYVVRRWRQVAAFVAQRAHAYWGAFLREWQELWEG